MEGKFYIENEYGEKLFYDESSGLRYFKKSEDEPILFLNKESCQDFINKFDWAGYKPKIKEL